jgi:hypothetical protein
VVIVVQPDSGGDVNGPAAGDQIQQQAAEPNQAGLSNRAAAPATSPAQTSPSQTATPTVASPPPAPPAPTTPPATAR